MNLDWLRSEQKLEKKGQPFQKIFKNAWIWKIVEHSYCHVNKNCQKMEGVVTREVSTKSPKIHFIQMTTASDYTQW